MFSATTQKLEDYSEESLDMSLSHTRLDVPHHEHVGVSADLGRVPHQLDLLLALPDLHLVDHVIKSRAVHNEVLEPRELSTERALSRVAVLPHSIDVDHRGALLRNKGLNIRIVVHRVDLEVLLVLRQLQDFHPELEEIRLLLGEDVHRAVRHTDESVATRLVHSSAPPEVGVLHEGVLHV